MFPMRPALVSLALAAPSMAWGAPAHAAAASAGAPPALTLGLAATSVLALSALGGLAARAVRRARRRQAALDAVAEAATKLAAGEAVQLDKAAMGVAEPFNAMAGAFAERERRVRHMAMHDDETGLSNRFALEWRL